MSNQNQRVEISQDAAAEALFRSDRTCCVCRQRGKPVQLHHIDDNSSNSIGENLAVLCFDCHRETQIRGGFDRKLDASQVRLYKSDWLNRVEEKRSQERPSSVPEKIDRQRALRYLQLKEKSDEHLYDFEADYALIGSGDCTSDSETNLCINAFVTRNLQRFRVDAVGGSEHKHQMKDTSLSAAGWDSLTISHTVSLFTDEIFSLEFQLASYGAGAAHPNYETQTLNFRLHPSMQLELQDLFKHSSSYLDVLSAYCIEDLHKQHLRRWDNTVERAEMLKHGKDEWILRGAAPEYRNYERISLSKNGVTVHFDPYQVDCYAAGKYEVFIPAYELKSVIQDGIAGLLRWL